MNKLKIVVLFTIFFASIVPLSTHAFTVPCFEGMRCPGQDGLNDVRELIVFVINSALSVAGLITVLMVIFGGFRYIVSGGNEESAEKAKHTIINALIGIVIIILSYTIVNSVSNFVTFGPGGGR